MKLSFIFITICISSVFAVESHSQSAKVSIYANNLQVKKVIDQIESQTDFLFVYNNDQVDLNRKVSIDAEDVPVSEILSEVFDQSEVAYIVEGNNVLLMKKPMNIQPQQTIKKVTGTVVDAAGVPIIGANVIERGTLNGMTTDSDGKFSLTLEGGDELEVSYISYKTQIIPINNRASISVVLIDDAEALEEVVVIGYGSQRRSDVTTSIASVSTEKLQDRAIVSIGEALAGQMPGVQVQQVNGAPGGEGLNIRIRGTGSISGSREPLYVVDGYPMEEGAFRLISPSSIESIQILKDASSTAIYGSRGANGVVIITTKRGKEGEPTVTLNAFVGFQQREKEIEMMNRDQYVEWLIDGRNEAWLDASIVNADPDKSPHKVTDSNERRKLYPSASTSYMIPDGKDGYKYDFQDPASVAQMEDNNWQDLLYRNALMHQYELSVSGGSDKALYNISASYVGQDGIVIASDYERYNVRANLTSHITDNFEIGMNLSAYYSTGKQQPNGKDSPVMYALNLPPIYPLFNEDGTYGSMIRNPEILAGDEGNPIAVAELRDQVSTRYGWVATLYADWEIIKNLTYRISINANVQDMNREFYQFSNLDQNSAKAPRPAVGTYRTLHDVDWVIENTLNYSHTFNRKHRLNALVGYTTQQHSYQFSEGEARTFPNDKIHTLNAGTMYALETLESRYSMISYLGRLNYSYDDRYLITATVRGDGSSRFGKNNKWGVFPSVSLGWRIMEEKFMENVKSISDLRLRASFGISGNNRIGNYSAVGLLETGFYPTGGGLATAVSPDTMFNHDLGWERTEQYNVGFDFGLFNNRIHLSADFYHSQSQALLLKVPIPNITGYEDQQQNVGRIQNKGMEYLLSTKNFTGDFKWSSDFNISFNKNEVLELGADGQPIYGSASSAGNAFITRIGDPIASFWGYEYMGVYMSQEEIDATPHLINTVVGDGQYKDVNGDGILDENDKTILGDNHPVFTAGFSNTFSYKNFSLNVQFTGSFGAETFSFFKRMTGIYHGDRNGMIQQVDRWRSTEEPGDGIHFRPTRTPYGWMRSPSSAWVEDASYLRLRNLSLSYDFNTDLLRSIRVKGLKLYVTGQNLFTITNYPGYDPETSSESGLSQGGDYASYPSARSYIFGVNITF